jgi:lipopolysaccharide export system protein LptA
MASDEVRADRSETRSDGDLTRRTYAGSVSATFRHSSVTSDSAVVTSDSNQYLFHQDVRYEDGKYVVFADHLLFDSANQIATLSGDVRLSDGEQSLTAGRVVYRASREIIEASKGVRIKLGEDEGIIRADSWFRDVASDSSAGSGDVRFSRVRTDSLQIRSDSVVAKSAREMVFSADVHLRHGEWTASSANAAVLESERITLSGMAQLSRLSGDSDSVSASSDTAHLNLESGQLSELVLAQHAEIGIQHANMDTVTLSTVSADSSWLTFEAESLSQLTASGSVEMRFDTPGRSTSTLQGSFAIIRFREDKPYHVLIKGQGEMVHKTADSALSATISGVGLEVDLTRSVLGAVRVDSNAVCNLEGEHPTRLSGDRLHLTFEDSRLIQAEVEGRVRGQYRTQEGHK